MLKEEQVHALIEKCETLVGVPLKQVRGNLANPTSRSAAIFELLAIETCAELGQIEYEPFPNSPDIRLILPSGDVAWIEVAFLHDKFWEQERQSRDLSQILHAQAQQLGIAPHKLWFRFNGRPSADGFKRELPQQHELKQFLRTEYAKTIFERIAAEPDEAFSLSHPQYTLTTSYVPTAIYGSGGGLVQEAPKHYKRHQLFKVIKQKAQQHSVEGMRLVCIGTDQSNALSNSSAPGTVSATDAVWSAFRETASLGGVITVEIKDVVQPFGRLHKQAFTKFYVNQDAKVELSPNVREAIMSLNFNRWKYHHRLNQYENPSKGLDRKLLGGIGVTTKRDGATLEIPCALLIEVLAGRESFVDGGSGLDAALAHLLSGAYRIEGCAFVPANVELGEGAKIKLDVKDDLTSIFDKLSKPKSKD